MSGVDNAMRGKFRRRQPGTPKLIAADCAGLRPEAVLVYGERAHERASRPSGTGRTVATELAAHCQGKGELEWELES